MGLMLAAPLRGEICRTIAKTERTDRRVASALCRPKDLPFERLHLHAKGFVAGAALLAEDRQTNLERFEILDLALGLGDGLGEVRGVLLKAGLVLPDFR